MKVLYMTARPPFPQHKGDQLIAWEQIKQLKANNHSVYLITFVTSDEELHLLKSKLSVYCEEIIGFRRSKYTQILSSIKTFFNLKPLQVNIYNHEPTKRKVLIAYQNIQPDIVHIQTARIADYFMEINSPKCVDMIDALSLNMKRRANGETFLLKKVLAFEYLLMKRFEKKVLANYDQVMLVSEKDKSYLENDRIIVNPNGTFITPDYMKKYTPSRREKIILFHGNMQYYPNVEAVCSFADEVWPVIHEDYPDYKFYIVGRDPEKKITRLHGKDNIVVTGFVEDICSYLTKAMIGVYLLKSGTGMQNKILEAMASGLPIVASPLALQGITHLRGNELIRAEHKDKVINAIKTLIENEGFRKGYQRTGPAFVEEHYTWEKNYLILLETWRNAIMNKSVQQTSFTQNLEVNMR